MIKHECDYNGISTYFLVGIAGSLILLRQTQLEQAKAEEQWILLVCLLVFMAPKSYSSMLAEKLLSKSDYDIDREIRTLELLKVKVWKCH